MDPSARRDPELEHSAESAPREPAPAEPRPRLLAHPSASEPVRRFERVQTLPHQPAARPSSPEYSWAPARVASNRPDGQPPQARASGGPTHVHIEVTNGPPFAADPGQVAPLRAPMLTEYLPARVGRPEYRSPRQVPGFSAGRMTVGRVPGWSASFPREEQTAPLPNPAGRDPMLTMCRILNLAEASEVVASLQLAILILADEGVEDSVINSDSRSLATLLLIRDIQSKRMPYEVCFSGAPARGPSRSAHIVPGAAAAAAAAAFAAGGLGAAASGAGAGVGAGADGAAGSSGIGNGNGNGGSWIRQMQKASQQSIVISEILDSRTRSLVAVSKISDYVLSNELVSMALAMVSEDREINRVLEELFSEEGNDMYIRPAELYLYEGEDLSFFEGNEIYIRPAELYLYEGEELSFFAVMGNEMYIRPAELYLYEGEELSFFEGNEMYIRPAELYLYEGEELSFFEVMVRARQRLEIVIGYRLGGEEVAVLNPPNKSAARQWSLSDAFIVLSLEE
ncbi:unnamed protein product [Closterium sp. NIES-65]|nr:unnamed protein product [Closterium sp. NIES-65]